MGIFYVGQKLWAINPCIMENGANEGEPALIVGKMYENKLDNGIAVIDEHGEYHSFTGKPEKFFSIQQIEQHKTVLTEWQRKNLMRCKWLTDKWIMEDIESILSEPEPPKYQPKKNEPVLASDGGCLWAGVFIGMRGDKYVCAIGGYKNAYDKVFPFNADLVGNVTD